MRKLILLLPLLLLIIGCVEKESYESAIQNYSVQSENTPLSNSVKLHIIKSDKWKWYKQDEENRVALEDFVNSGQYEIVKTNTVYQKGYLLAAEIYYKEK